MNNYYELFDPFPNEEKIVYGRIVDIETNQDKNQDENQIVVNITLINDKMLEYDNDIYGDKGLLINITKYLKDKDEESIEAIKRLIQKYDLENELRWILQNKSYDNKRDYVYLKKLLSKFKPYFYEFSAKISSSNKYYEYFNELNERLLICDNCNECECSYHNSNLIFKITCNENNVKEDNGIKGDVLFSASPIKVKKGILYIEDDNIDNIYKNNINKHLREIFKTTKNVYNATNISDLEETLNNTFPDKLQKLKYTMYYVGQGLCSYININRNYGLFYDVGFSKYGSNDESINMNNEETYTRYINKKPKVVILSHWDTDHILGVVYCDEEVYDRIWIAPDINEFKYMSNSALRLSKYLSLREEMRNIAIVDKSKMVHTLFLISSAYNNKLVYSSKYDNIKIYRAKGTGTTGLCNKKNNVGLVVEFTINKSNLLLTGDVDYKKIPDVLKTKKFDYIQVPHHGGNVGEPILYPKHLAESIALVPVSERMNDYSHPDYINHLNKLAEYGFCVFKSDDFYSNNNVAGNMNQDTFVINC